MILKIFIKYIYWLLKKVKCLFCKNVTGEKIFFQILKINIIFDLNLVLMFTK